MARVGKAGRRRSKNKRQSKRSHLEMSKTLGSYEAKCGPVTTTQVPPSDLEATLRAKGLLP